MSQRLVLVVVALAAFAVSVVLALASAKPSNAFIHEMIGASCRQSLLGDVEPPGQVPGGPPGNATSTTRALIATGVISSIVPGSDPATGPFVQINFDLSRPNAKFVSAGFSLLIPDGAAPGVDLVLNPLPTLDGSTFPAFVHCNNLRPA
jgi:hypothetical protein